LNLRCSQAMALSARDPKSRRRSLTVEGAMTLGKVRSIGIQPE